MATDDLYLILVFEISFLPLTYKVSKTSDKWIKQFRLYIFFIWNDFIEEVCTYQKLQKYIAISWFHFCNIVAYVKCIKAISFVVINCEKEFTLGY